MYIRLSIPENVIKWEKLSDLEYIFGNKIKSLRSYKGIESKDNIYLVYRVLEIEKGLK